ncbi:hypothetical protein XENTR_v10013121 [Xenopus tropicalis]|uniref:Exportin-5 n=2 Tax=Xenopus tropicalis TaxID=8364 RepID=A0A8J1JHW3_XENTR|nr:exportin 5 isoform X1 [Xenopus tropicalis]KAE8600179.1 hypothetical protein XENTR_v10013121 [Xenopus tropicalis]
MREGSHAVDWGRRRSGAAGSSHTERLRERGAWEPQSPAMDEQVPALCEQLVRAVTVMLEPESRQEYRLEALKFCEEFKERSPLCVPCGLQLSNRSHSPCVRHFGLHVLEHVIKFRWNDMSREEKVCLKDSVMDLISHGMHPILEEESHIKDMMARIVVEMAKREWPQHWPDLLNELDSLTRVGEAQTELVMFILLRLAEDVVTFQNLPTQRRRDIQTTMTQKMDVLFAFMLNILQQSVQQYQHLKTDPANSVKAQGMCRVAVASLKTLAGYIDWVAITHIMADNCKLLGMLCVLLSEPELQLEAAECLLIAVSRKGKLEDRIPLLILFGDEAIEYILSVAQMADTETLEEKRYILLKRICQLICTLGTQICALTQSPDLKVNVPGNFNKYLETLLSFTRHASQFLTSSTILTWGTIFRHEVLSRHPQLLAAIPDFLRSSMVSIVRVGFPSKDNSPSCKYSRMDYESDEDFNGFFNSFRALMGGVVRAACYLDPHTGFCIAKEWLQFQLSAPLDPGPHNAQPGDALCSPTSTSFLQWEAMTFFCECVTSQLFRVVPKEELPVAEGIGLLQQVLSYETMDPLILSFVLTNLSSLMPFITCLSSYVPPVLSKLLDAISFPLSGDMKVSKSRGEMNVRRHANSSLIKVCRDYPELVQPHFEQLHARVTALLGEEQLLTQMGKCALMEALILASNQFKSYDRQQVLLEELIGPLVSGCVSEKTQRAFSGPDEFIYFVGADILMHQQEEEDRGAPSRSQLSLCTFALLGMVKRSQWPTDPEEAKAGGFVIGYSASGAPLLRNPGARLLLKVLDSLLALIRTMNNLYLPEVMGKMGDTFCKSLNMLAMDRKLLMGTSQSAIEDCDLPAKTNLSRIQFFFASLFDNCCQILGHCGPSMPHEFYSVPDLASRLLSSVFTNADNVPDYRLRLILRVLVKPLILSCPAEKYESLVCPILGPLIIYLYQRLSQKWLSINQRTVVSEEDYTEEDSECQEVLEEQLVRQLTREVVDLIGSCCIARKSNDFCASGADVGHSAGQADGDEEEMMTTEAVAPGPIELTELGQFLLANEEISTSLLVISFSPLVWKDTMACQKAASHLCWPLLKQVMSASPLPADAALCVFSNILCGLQTHGQHESCKFPLVQLSFQTYEALRPQYPELRGLMEQVPDVPRDSLEQFDAKLLAPPQKVGEKKRREHFKKLIAGCIGKPLGEQFRKEVHIRNLPALFKKKTKSAPDSDSVLSSCDSSLVALFQP